MTIHLGDNVKLFWNNFWEKIKKYWQIFLGLFVGLGFAANLWWRLRSQKKVLQNEIEAAKKVREIEEDFDKSVKKVEKSALESHNLRVSDIEVTDEEARLIITKDLEDRVEENNNGSNKDLAKKIGKSFNVDIILPEDEDA